MASSNAFFHKPELALRRAVELRGIHQDQAALTLLHDVLSSRRHRTWSPAYEQIMITYLDLCLKMHKSREAKDGLHQYRNLSQSQAPGSLEKVIRYLMNRAEEQVAAAKAASDADETSAAAEAAAAAAATSSSENDDDEGGFGTTALSPQAILLSTMSTDPAKSQRDSTVLLPSLKFLWEIYRSILDILRSNSKLEHVYHAAAQGALKSCRVYKRRMEFRHLCDMLRTHLGNLRQYGTVDAAAAAATATATAPEEGDTAAAATATSKPNNKVRGWEGWTTESIELHLQTRFCQLETASALHRYTEGFRTVEDIYNILQISHQRRRNNAAAPPPKAKLMAAYYEKLTTLFWVSENYLFHAFAWYKYYTLCREYNRGMSAEAKKLQASAVLLAALCIPSLPGRPKSAAENGSKQQHQQQHTLLSAAAAGGQQQQLGSALEEDVVKQQKMSRMAVLLGFHTRNPTREALIQEIRRQNILEQVPEYLRDLYYLLEETVDPLEQVSAARPLLEQLKREMGDAVVLASSSDAAAAAAAEGDDADAAAAADGKVDTTDDAAAAAAAAAEAFSLGQYVKPLTHVLLLKLVVNLSAAYHTVSMDHVKKLTADLPDTNFEQVEKSIVLFTQTKTVQVKIDHRMKCLRFGDDRLESDAMRSQLTVLSKQLNAVARALRPPDAAAAERNRLEQLSSIRANLRAEHAAVTHRKHVIEQRKERMEMIAQQRAREEVRQKQEEEAARRAEEQRRIALEQRRREMDRQRKIQEEMDNRQKKQMLEAMGKRDVSAEEMAKIDAAKLQKEHQEKINKKREEAERKMKEAAKKLDYLVRAIRIEELPLIQDKYSAKRAADKKRYEHEQVEKLARAEQQWKADVKDRGVLEKHGVFTYFVDFEKAVMAGRRVQHNVDCRKAEAQAEIDAERDKLNRARQRKEAAEAAKAAEEARRIEEEAAAEAAEEKRKREAAKKEREAREEEKRLAELRRMEEEQQRRRREQEVQQAKQPPPTTSSSRGGGGGGITAGTAGGSGGGGGRYVPPSRRGQQGGGPGGPGGGGGGSRFGNDAGGYPGGGRYDGSRGGAGGGGSRWGAARDNYGGGGGGGGGGGYDRDRPGYGRGYDRDRPGYDDRRGPPGDRDRGAYGDRDRGRGGGGRDDRGGGGPGGGNQRWR